MSCPSGPVRRKGRDNAVLEVLGVRHAGRTRVCMSVAPQVRTPDYCLSTSAGKGVLSNGAAEYGKLLVRCWLEISRKKLARSAMVSP